MARDRNVVAATVLRLPDGRFRVVAGDLTVTAWRKEVAAEVAIELAAGGARLALPTDVETIHARAP